MNQTPRALRILMIEDEAGDARLMQVAIRRNGFVAETHEAHDGHEALCFLRKQAPHWVGAMRPDLILLDLKMPGQVPDHPQGRYRTASHSGRRRDVFPARRRRAGRLSARSGRVLAEAGGLARIHRQGAHFG